MIQVAEPYVFVGDVFRLLMELGDRPHLVYRLNHRWWLIAPVVETGGQTVKVDRSEEPTAPPPIGQWSYFHYGFWGWSKDVDGIELPMYLKTVSQQYY